MAEVYFPFDAGPGSTVTESQWRSLARLMSRGSGVAAGLQVSSATGQAVTVGVGSALVDGMYYATDAPVTVNVPGNSSSSQPVAGSVVLRLDPAADKVSLVAKLGTPAASPAPPTLTQSPTGVWEELLGDFRLPVSGQAQNPTGLVDRRRILGAPGLLVYTGSIDVPNNTEWGVGDLVPDAANPAQSWCSPKRDGVTLQPGSYDITWSARLPVALTGYSYAEIRLPGGATETEWGAGGTFGIRVPSAKALVTTAGDVVFTMRQTSGATRRVTHRIAIQRTGDIS